MKDHEMRRLLGLTWCGWLNFLLLQWLCLRLVRVVDDDDDTVTGYQIRWMPIWKIGFSLPTLRNRK